VRETSSLFFGILGWVGLGWVGLAFGGEGNVILSVRLSILAFSNWRLFGEEPIRKYFLLFYLSIDNPSQTNSIKNR